VWVSRLYVSVLSFWSLCVMVTHFCGSALTITWMRAYRHRLLQSGLMPSWSLLFLSCQHSYAIILNNVCSCHTNRCMHEHTDTRMQAHMHTHVCMRTHTHIHCISDRPRSQSQVQAAMSRLRAPMAQWKKLPLRWLVCALSTLHLLPDGNIWNRSCADCLS